MLSGLIGLLVAVIVLAVIYWAVHTVAAAAGIPGIVVTIADVLLVLILLYVILWFFGLVAGPYGAPALRTR